MDFYSVLGVSQHASHEEIKRAFRQQALANHPDRHAGRTPAEKDQAELAFRRASEAYEVLSNEAKRQAYNTAGRAGRAGDTHAAQGSTATYGAYGGSYYGSPKVRTGWSNFRYRQKTYGTNRCPLVPSCAA